MKREREYKDQSGYEYQVKRGSEYYNETVIIELPSQQQYQQQEEEKIDNNLILSRSTDKDDPFVIPQGFSSREGGLNSKINELSKSGEFSNDDEPSFPEKKETTIIGLSKQQQQESDDNFILSESNPMDMDKENLSVPQEFSSSKNGLDFKIKELPKREESKDVPLLKVKERTPILFFQKSPLPLPLKEVDLQKPQINFLDSESDDALDEEIKTLNKKDNLSEREGFDEDIVLSLKNLKING